MPTATRFAPLIFVLLWSTGYIASKAGASYAEPYTFLAIRFAIVTALLLLGWTWLRPDRLSARGWSHSIVIGALIHGIYLGLVFWAIAMGMPAGVAALVVCLQPLLTAIVAGIALNERINAWNWAGLAIGLVGAGLVVGPKAVQGVAGFEISTLVAVFGSLFAITLGTLLQKAWAQTYDVRASLLPQYIGALIVVTLASVAFETGRVDWTTEFIIVIIWLVLVLSLGAISLLLYMIRENAVWRTAALFYLVPPVTAALAWALFGETLTNLQLAGMIVVSGAVLLTQMQTAPKG